MAYVKIWVHAVWATKNRHPFLIEGIKEKVIAHILENARKKEIFIDCLNGHTEHLHCLFALNADMSVAKALQLLKGESAFWINKEKLTPQKFEWGDEYYAASIADSGLDKVRAYISNQEEHHKKKTFMMEYEDFLMDMKMDVRAKAQ